MKKTLAVLLALCLAAGLIGCGQSVGSTADAAQESPAPTDPPAKEKPELKVPNDNTGVKTKGTVLGSKSCDTEPDTVYSDIWEVPEKGSVTKRFYNYTDGIGMWNNFLVCLQSTPDGHSEEENKDYRSIAVLRADHFLSGEDLDDVVMESDWDWDSFTEDMNGALIELTVSRKDSKADVSFTATTADGTIHQQSYKGIPAEGPLYFCLSVDHAFLDLLPEETPEPAAG